MRNKTKQSPDELDLVASGTSGRWTVLVEDTHTGPAKRFLQIEGPSVCFTFELLAVGILEELLGMLDQPRVAGHGARRSSSLRLGLSNRTPITLVRDDEYADRCFLLVGPESSPIVRHSIAGSDLSLLTDALRQASEELASEHGNLGRQQTRSKSRSAS